MKTTSAFVRAIGAALSLLLLTHSSTAQSYYFGQNKVHYKKFNWAIFQTAHFDVHFYPEEEEAARDAARMAERGYTYLSKVFDHEFDKRIPLILYASVNDFQQTNVVDEIGHGTRGVTESVKGRVVLPLTGSYGEFNHVLVHELVHAFQFDIMLNAKNMEPTARYLAPPLWFVEGMAEYLSVGMDNITRMWVRDGLEHNNLLSVEKLGNTFDIRVYRLGQSLWHFIGEKYGKKKVGSILKTAVRIGDINKAFKLEIGLGEQPLTEAWHSALRESIVPTSELLRPASSIATRVTKKESFFHRMNVVPAISPDGRRIAYVTDKNLADDIYITEIEDDGSMHSRRLIKGSQSTDFEALRYFDTTINWSRDGQFVTFVSKSGKDDALYVMRTLDGKQVYRFTFADLNGLLSPAFSPDGKKLVFTGIAGGWSDLYILELATGKRTRLTSDRFADLQPQWSPNGETIAFITDRGPGTDEEALLFGDYDLALYHLPTGKIDGVTELDGNVTSPQWSPDGQAIAFVAEHQGIPNIYRIDLGSRQIIPVTYLRSSVAGITPSTPAMSWSANGRYMAFSTFEDGMWQIYRLALPQHGQTYQVMNDRSHSFASFAQQIEVEKAAADSVWVRPLVEQTALYDDYELFPSDSIVQLPYRVRPSFDGGALGANFGGFLGSTSGLTLQFSDMLGNHRFLTGVGLRLAFWNSDLSLVYVNQANRINFGIEGFQLRNAYGAFVTRNQLGFVRQTYRGLNAFALYPLNRFARFEIGVGLTHASQDLLVDTYSAGGRERESLDIGGDTFGQLNAALIFDNVRYAAIGPISGSRSRLSVQHALKDLQFTTYILDHRRYFNIANRSTIAARLLTGGSSGQDAQIFQFGGPSTLRGANYGQMIGNKFLIGNLEYRFPLLPFLPPYFDFLSASAFFDVGAAWGVNIPGLSKETFQPFSAAGGFHLNDLQAAFGLGLRFNLGLMLLKYEMAIPTDFQKSGKPITLFSIGTDF